MLRQSANSTGRDRLQNSIQKQYNTRTGSDLARFFWNKSFASLIWLLDSNWWQSCTRWLILASTLKNMSSATHHTCSPSKIVFFVSALHHSKFSTSASVLKQITMGDSLWLPLLITTANTYTEYKTTLHLWSVYKKKHWGSSAFDTVTKCVELPQYQEEHILKWSIFSSLTTIFLWSSPLHNQQLHTFGYFLLRCNRMTTYALAFL